MTTPRWTGVTALLCLTALLLPGCGGDNGVRTQEVEIAGRVFELELALDDASRRRGLSYRESIPEDGGMLFVFPEQRVLQFHMRECLVPIDVIFLNEWGYIVQSHHMPVEPPETRANPQRTYSSVSPAAYAIELRGGTLEALPIGVGDRVRLPFAELKAMAE